MNLIDIMLKRRSVRKYKDEDITKDKLDSILKAGLLAPTSRNRKPCNFLVVENKQTLERLSKSKKTGAEMLASCSKAIVVVANTMISDTWIEDSSIALIYMHLMASSIDVGSCWVQIHLRKTGDGKDSEEVVKEIVGIDDYFRVVGILALGVPDDEVKPHTLDDIDKSKIHFLV
ncbi:nitroreductase family protein [Methanobrevibacter sp.]|uniref:nitroreductase family protein n=1 Tax=Methanobrevibacter sp. TaxID=66852 RepID=UPI0026DFB7C2|nr:nitroreductase family protein [Methanobrevibacter sp.]MDO5859652.1 nitroreductase family protein [Methanobrevibacter sp.]